MKSKSIFKIIVFVLVFFVLFPGVRLWGARDKQKPQVITGAVVTLGNGTLVRWRDLKKITFDLPGSRRRIRPILNFADPRKIAKKSRVLDPVVQTSLTGKQALKGGILALTQPLLSFEGMNHRSNGAGWPPDPNGDVGIQHYVQTVNTSVAIYNKSTGALVSATTFNAFFPTASGGPCDNDNNGDPIVLYDRYHQRWFILGFSWYPSRAGGSFFSIAASKTSDPTGEWWTYCVNADNTLMNDYPKCGVWHDGIYVTANMFQFSGGFQHARIWALKTPDLYNGRLTAQSVRDASPVAFSLMPANARGSNPPTTGTPNYLYSIDADEWGEGHLDALYVWKYRVNWSNPGSTALIGPTMITVAPYEMASSGVPQQGSATLLDSLYGRLMFSATYRRFSGFEAVYLCHVAEYNNRRALRWYEIRINEGESSVFQQGTYSPDSTHRWMGSICADKYGSIAMGYSASSTSLFPSIRYCGRRASDPPGVMAQGEATLHAGSGAQNDYTRWGDYSSLTIDPTDDETFWFTTEYLSVTGNNWRSRIGSFKINTLAPPASKSLEEAIDNTSLQLTTSSSDGSGDWKPVTQVFYHDGDSAQSGPIKDNQETAMETTLDAKTNMAISFYWKVSSEAKYDTLRFLVDGTQKAQISGETDWTSVTVNLEPGNHALAWSYHKDVSISRGADAGWVDKVVLVDTAPLGNTLAAALDNKTFKFTTGGNADWFPQPRIFFYGGQAAQSPTLTHGENGFMETSISDFNIVRFYWKASSEANYDYLSFYIDGVLKDRISGSVEWEQKSYTLTPGRHKLKWTYSKDESVSEGLDACWVDKLEIVNGIDPIAQATDNPKLSFSHSGHMNWEVDTGDACYGNTSATAPQALNNNQSAVMETVISDVSAVSFYWKVSSEANYDFLQFYLDGALQDQISGTTDWAKKVFPLTSGSHTLKWIYIKDHGVSGGNDTGWVDRIEVAR